MKAVYLFLLLPFFAAHGGSCSAPVPPLNASAGSSPWIYLICAAIAAAALAVMLLISRARRL